jgi:hypothetical protein
MRRVTRAAVQKARNSSDGGDAEADGGVEEDAATKQQRGMGEVEKQQQTILGGEEEETDETGQSRSTGVSLRLHRLGDGCAEGDSSSAMT